MTKNKIKLFVLYIKNIKNNKSNKLHKLFKHNKLNFYNLYKIRKILDNKLSCKFNQKGGFFYDQNDDFILQILDTIDFIFDIINILPNYFFKTHTQFVTLPYMILSFYSNLLRNNYEMAFYTLIGIIPGIGSIISTSSKIILRIIKYNQKMKHNKEKLDKLNQIKFAKEIKKILKSNYSKSFNYPFLSDFENNYD